MTTFIIWALVVAAAASAAEDKINGKLNFIAEWPIVVRKYPKRTGWTEAIRLIPYNKLYAYS